MVDFVKRATKAVALRPDEEMRGAINVTASPFLVSNAGMTGGAIAGGLVGAAIGAAVDARISGKEGERDLPAIAARVSMEPGIPTNGALAAVSSHRMLLWKISAMGKPRDILHEIPLGDIDAVVWEDTDAKWLGGKPKSIQVWVGVREESVLSAAAIAMGPANKWAHGLVDAFRAGLGSRVTEFGA